MKRHLLPLRMLSMVIALIAMSMSGVPADASSASYVPSQTRISLTGGGDSGTTFRFEFSLSDAELVSLQGVADYLEIETEITEADVPANWADYEYESDLPGDWVKDDPFQNPAGTGQPGITYIDTAEIQANTPYYVEFTWVLEPSGDDPIMVTARWVPSILDEGFFLTEQSEIKESGYCLVQQLLAKAAKSGPKPESCVYELIDPDTGHAGRNLTPGPDANPSPLINERPSSFVATTSEKVAAGDGWYVVDGVAYWVSAACRGLGLASEPTVVMGYDEIKVYVDGGPAPTCTPSEETPTPTPTPGDLVVSTGPIRLIITGDKTGPGQDGWVLHAGRKTWVKVECRPLLEAAGIETDILDWLHIRDGIGDASPQLSCGQALALVPASLSVDTSASGPNAGSDVIQPNAGADAIQPNAGSDVLQPNAGSDVIQPNAGSDVLQPTAGTDALTPVPGGAPLAVEPIPTPPTISVQPSPTPPTISVAGGPSSYHNRIIEVTGTGRSVNPSFLMWDGVMYHIGSGDDYWECRSQVGGVSGVVQMSSSRVQNWPKEWADNVDRCW